MRVVAGCVLRATSLNAVSVRFSGLATTFVGADPDGLSPVAKGMRVIVVVAFSDVCGVVVVYRRWIPWQLLRRR